MKLFDESSGAKLRIHPVIEAEGLQQIALYKKSATTDVLAAQVGRVLEKYKMGKFKSLGHVERAVRNLKTAQLECVLFADRIRTHVFLCMLAYYFRWHMTQRLQPLFDSDGIGSEREWTFSGLFDWLTHQAYGYHNEIHLHLNV